VVSAPRLYGFMNLAANEIHHEEEYTFFGCCSAQFSRFMLPPRHIQGA